MDNNLPPGVTDSMIPGGRPEDEAFLSWQENLKDEDFLDYIKKFVESTEAQARLFGFLFQANQSIQESYKMTCGLFHDFSDFLEKKFDEKEEEENDTNRRNYK